ncbi:oleate-activated transcription factor 1 [Fusarium austroafricanum]|uniref:Oleate-activated transcription factor 1 n=1 Tax=Fusarium austroafricanum TaxID=2364996 RepID=A0A8H4KG69_9HYPO|nr:oleate-activated transcription factor 1 [Fusarium austroafricanum]
MGVLHLEAVQELSLTAKLAALPALVLLYFALNDVYYAFFHPLAKVPGPRLYAVTQIPYFYHLAKGDWVATLSKLHDQYGPAVRYTPHDVSFITADAVKTIYGHKTSGGQEFPKDPRMYRQNRPVTNILTSNHDDHKRMRRLLSHAFSMKALRNQEDIIKHYVDLFVSRLTDRARQGTVVDMVAWYNFATFDLIGHLAMGQPFGCLENSEYHPWVRVLFNGIKVVAFTQILARLKLQKWYTWFVPAKYTKATKTHHQFTEHTALARVEANDTKSQDFMSYILRHNDEKGMSKAEIVENAGLLILAGSETTATLLSGTTYHLLKNPDKMKKLVNEIRSTFSSEEEITLTAVDHLTYLLACFSEGFRMYPPVAGGLSRFCPAGGEFIDGYWIPEKTAVSVSHRVAYHSAYNFKDPELFVPERWLDDPKYANDNKAVLQPFSAGPRDCIGKNLAYTEMRILLTRLLWKFDLELQPESSDWANQKVFLLYEKPGMSVRLTEVVREKTTQFPNRRRVIQACVNCRMRKTRCDAAQPRCGLCTSQDVDCVYRDARQPKVDYNTQVLLERMQLLEDRLLSSASSSQTNSLAHHTPPINHQEPSIQQQPNSQSDSHEPVFEVQIPLSHTANANHVFSWGLVQELLSETSNDQELPMYTDATEVFFQQRQSDTHPSTTSRPPLSWRLYDDPHLFGVSQLRELVNHYFTHVNIFFPLLLKSNILDILDKVTAAEVYKDEQVPAVEMPQYGLLLVVLCLSVLSSSGQSNIRLDNNHGNPHATPESSNIQDKQIKYHLWDKARLILGYVSTDMSLAAAQSSMLASIYMGASGMVSEAFHWAHTTAVKCESMARSFAKNETIPDAFRRLYWISFIYECDFISEISIVSPSGIARYEDKIPFPAFTAENNPISPSGPESSDRSQEELVAFQITTNSAIRRFLNTVNSVVYDDKEQFRTRRSNYASWLLRIAEDLRSHHAAIYHNLPEFLLTNSSQDVPMTGADLSSPASLQSPTARIQGIPVGNNSWNILRLKGRYYAGQYIIHRPFIEFIVLNIENFESHPCKDAVLKRSKSCLDGCMGFIKVFDVETANSLTCLFPTGLVFSYSTFTMTIILMVATMFPVFRNLLPEDVEEGILTGKRNIVRFSQSVTEFAWHIAVLERLDVARRNRIVR